MKTFLFATLLISSQAFSVVSVDCKISSSLEFIANFDSSNNSISVTRKESKVESNFPGISFEQINKADLNQNQKLIDLAKANDIPIAQANSANHFVIQKSGAETTELVDFISIDAESIGAAAILGSVTQRCLLTFHNSAR